MLVGGTPDMDDLIPPEPPVGTTGEMFDTVFLGDRNNPVRMQFTSVVTDNTYLDEDNPRLRFKRTQFPNRSLEELLFEEDDTKLLKLDIQANGLNERPYVRRNADGTFTSIEGNRRLACFKSLHAEFKDDDQWAYMPALLLPPTITPQQESVLMGAFHVSGRVKWDAHERAGHVYRMHRVLKVPMETMKTTLHMGEPAIMRMVTAYDVMMEHYAKIDGGKYAAQAEGKYSFFAEFVANKDWRKKIDEPDVFFIDQFCEWVGSGRIPTAMDVRQLPEILARRETRTTFETGEPGVAFSQARSILDNRNPSRKSKFFKVLKTMVEAGKHADLSDIEMAGSNDIAKELLLQARQVIDRLSRQAQAMK